MAKPDNEILDSQIIADNIGFLDNCFDNSFTLENSLLVVKEFVGEEIKYITNKDSTLTSKISEQRSKISPITYNCDIPQRAIKNSQHGKFSKFLADWGLPNDITKNYEQRGIIEMFDWQVNCLSKSKVLLDYCNLVYSAPTSAGKTLVAEILSIKTVLERQKKVIVILPFVSIVREKMIYLQDILSSSGVRVEGFMGSQSPPGGLQSVHIAICTIEKANSLINHLLDSNSISDLGAVVVDELHLLGDPQRGYILELLLTKIKFVCSKLDEVNIQIIGMSATLPNLDALAQWLDAELFVTDFRPIPLEEYCLVDKKYYDKYGKYASHIYNDETMSDIDSVTKICLDTIKDGCSILIFCMTKNRCENLAQKLASSFFKTGCSGNAFGTMLRQQLKTEIIGEVLDQLNNCPVGLDQILKGTISFGVAYHHAGLTFDERDIIEAGFKCGAIRVLVATSTLSSGVNLPARKVIIRTPVFQKQPINILTYKQMIGRAGRMGKDTKGESILICTESEKKVGFELMMGVLNPVVSCLESGDKYMRAILEMIASEVASTSVDLDIYSKGTLLFTQQNLSISQDALLKSTLSDLENYELIRTQKIGDEIKFIATSLGKACLSSSMSPNDGLSLFCELQKARQCLVLEAELHLVYLVTPYSVSNQWANMDWLHLLTLWESLTKSMKRVGELVGVQESFIVRCLRGNNKSNAQNKLNIHKRFYTALALQDLVNEVPLSEVARKFQCARGFLQGLQQAAATFAGMATSFCRQLGWKNLEILISQFQDRLHFGVHSELIDLMKLPSLNSIRARTLFNSGFETISNIALADVSDIENSLCKSAPFQSEKVLEEDDEADRRKRSNLKNIWITGRCGMTVREAAENLILEARKHLELEIGVAVIKWNKQNLCNNSVIHNKSHVENVLVTEIKEIDSPKKINVNTLITNKINELNLRQDELEIKKQLENADNEIKIVEINSNEKTGSGNNITNQFSADFMRSTCLQNDFSQTGNEQASPKKSNTIDISTIQTKDETNWESLNFTEAAIKNLTKVRTSDHIFSPNISFSDSEEKTNSRNQSITNIFISKPINKDVSLFSSDGETSSFFDESLPINLIDSKVICDKNDSRNNAKLSIEEKSIDSSILINECVTIDTDDSENEMKLVYEGDADSQNVEVISTLEFNEIVVKSPSKRKANSFVEDSILSSKKLKTTFQKFVSFEKVDKRSPKLLCAYSYTFIMNLRNTRITCYVLKSNDIIDNLHIIENFNAIAIYLDAKSVFVYKNELIGRNINFRDDAVKKETKNDSQNKFDITGIGICDGSRCFYLELSSVNDNLELVNRISKWLKNKSMKLKTISLKSNSLFLNRCFGINLQSPCFDISLAEWLVNSEEKVPNIVYLVKKYINLDVQTIAFKIDNKEKKWKHFEKVEEICMSTWLIWEVAKKQEQSLLEKYHSVLNCLELENEISKILAECEFHGITVDKELSSQLLIDVKQSQDVIQKKAFKLCGYHFNFNSSKDVAKVLGIYKGRKISTKKTVLTAHNTIMSSLIIYWRKLNSILTKTLYPLTEQACIYSNGNRINPCYTIYTCTGRISMHEPNLQNVPRTFSIPVQYLSMDGGEDTDVIEFNCRNVFKAAAGLVLVSADYCQLEMRILTHYCKDQVLMNIMRSDIDVFKAIAASWGGVPDDKVDDDLRQKAKQLCYGILYGMGNKTLGQQLDVSEMEAAVFMNTFHKTYPGIRTFTESVIQECRSRGYVETLMKRRRYLPDINSRIPSKRNAAERQAVNTTIQGSAADIAKAAMCAIDKKTRNSKARLILQMHDELVYEVTPDSRNLFPRLLKDEMENIIHLCVPLPVKVKSGYSWGSMEEIVL